MYIFGSESSIMKRSIRVVALFSASLLLAQCTAKKTTTPKMTDEEVVAAVKKNYTEEQIKEGHILYTNTCGKCHDLFEPGSRTITKWERVIPRMAQKAEVSKEVEGKIRAYLVTNAKMQ